MRTVTLALLAGFTLGVVAPAQGADLDYGVLRGPDYEPETPVIDWNGIYVGGHGGYTSAALNFNNVYQKQLSDAYHDTTAENVFGISKLLRSSSARTEGVSYGAFAGFNYQFDEIVVGLEADYTHFGQSGSTFDQQGRTQSSANGLIESVYAKGNASTKILDYGTIRARGGYALGNFLPFVTGGLAIGRASVIDKVTAESNGFDSATYNANQNLAAGAKPAFVYNYGYATFDPANPEGSGSVPFAKTISRATTKVVGGITLGGGMEYAVTQNILLRAEYQYVLFNDFDGHKANLNTVRGGAAVKF